jgi:hypothetical protein
VWVRYNFQTEGQTKWSCLHDLLRFTPTLNPVTISALFLYSPRAYCRSRQTSLNSKIRILCLVDRAPWITLVQGDQKVSGHVMITIQEVMFKVSPASLHYYWFIDYLAADRQGQGDTRLTQTPSVIPNSKYVIMVSDWNCLKYFYVFLCCNRKLHRDSLISLYSEPTRCTVYLHCSELPHLYMFRVHL